MTEIITRKEALSKGLKRYFTGKACKHGHVAERVTSTKTCVECKRAQERFENMTPKQIEKRLAKARVVNMTPERIKTERARRRPPKAHTQKRLRAPLTGGPLFFLPLPTTTEATTNTSQPREKTPDISTGRV